MQKIKIIYSLLSLLFLIMGMSIYFFFRNLNNLLLFAWLPKPEFLLTTPLISFNTDTIWGYLFVFNMPHGLWCLSGLFVIRAIWLTNIKWRAIYAGIFIAAASSLEISQLSDNRPGTFDTLDLASYGLAVFLESITFHNFTKRRILC